MEKMPLSFGPENFDATPQKPWDKQPKTDHLNIKIDFGGRMEIRQPTEKEMIEGIAKGFNDFLISRTQTPWSGIGSEDILQAIKLGARDAFEGKDISHIVGGECGVLDVSVNTSIKKCIESLPKYRKYEYCEYIGCEHLDKLKSGDKIHCKMECGAYDYHDYLQERGFSIVKTGE